MDKKIPKTLSSEHFHVWAQNLPPNFSDNVLYSKIKKKQPGPSAPVLTFGPDFSSLVGLLKCSGSLSHAGIGFWRRGKSRILWVGYYGGILKKLLFFRRDFFKKISFTPNFLSVLINGTFPFMRFHFDPFLAAVNREGAAFAAAVLMRDNAFFFTVLKDISNFFHLTHHQNRQLDSYFN